MSVEKDRRDHLECGAPSGAYGDKWREAVDDPCPERVECYLWHTSSTSSGGWYVCAGHAIAVVAWLEEQYGTDPKLEIIREQA